MENTPLIVWALSVWFIASSAFRYVRVAKKTEPVPLSQRSGKAIIPKALMVASAALVLASICLGAPLFVDDALLTSFIALGLAMFFAAAFDALSAVRFPSARKPSQRAMVAPACSVLIALVALGYVFVLRSPPVFGEREIQLAYPVRGEWKVAAGGGTPITNYHHGNPRSQDYAVDMVFKNGDCAGAAIHAPLAGTVLEVIDGRRQGSAEPEGNLIVIETADNVQIWLAHLERDSLLIAKGDPVVAGQKIANCGSTGSAKSAHLHIHAQKEGVPVAMRFGKNRRFLLRNDSFKK